MQFHSFRIGYGCFFVAHLIRFRVTGEMHGFSSLSTENALKCMQINGDFLVRCLLNAQFESAGEYSVTWEIK